MHDYFHHLGLIDDEQIHLEAAALSLAHADHSGVDLAPYNDLLDAMDARLRTVGCDAVAAAGRADALAQVVAGDFGFEGVTERYDDPRDADFISVLDRRQGLPISLSIIWVALARRLGWTAGILDVPGHALVTVGAEVTPVIVDPFKGGASVTAKRFAALVKASSGSDAATNRAAMPNRSVLVRLLQNQAWHAEQAGQRRRALELYGRMTIIAPAYPHVWWERARLELRNQDITAARASLSTMLEITRAPQLRQRINAMLKVLSRS